MSRGIFDSSVVSVINSGAARLIDAPLVGALVRRNMVVIRCTGRRSGTTFQTPVSLPASRSPYQRPDRACSHGGDC